MIRILLDPVACDAYGYCAELLPEAISLDEWGYPMVDGRPLPPELVGAAKRAARDCPRRAITLQVAQERSLRCAGDGTMACVRSDRP